MQIFNQVQNFLTLGSSYTKETLRFQTSPRFFDTCLLNSASSTSLNSFLLFFISVNVLPNHPLQPPPFLAHAFPKLNALEKAGPWTEIVPQASVFVVHFCKYIHNIKKNTTTSTYRVPLEKSRTLPLLP